ncbi:hypothetical protein [Noviherbaspirillum sp. Root189]|uniref:hypothetical protein n=1 Tax=Noviherbaspirillum sp. Root189 TaxID=1736487 RepID=UPI00070B28FA|nr:hypothetical protein [Noviherbaspirillum sp. Root189]KRB82179.1 hypothetical protein ASE07_24090 [Noviherbaspirillum sp. Root189]
MTLDFLPQFHDRISHPNGGNIWVSAPHPETLIPMKQNYYRIWQCEEYQRLCDAGEEVVALAISF